MGLADHFLSSVDGELTAGVDRASIGLDHAGVLSGIRHGGVEHVHGDIAKLAGSVDPGA